MRVHVETEIEIDAPCARVAAYASDPDNVTAWYSNIKNVEWVTSPPIAVGSEIRFMAQFLGRKLAYTYRVLTLDPGRRFVMRTADGPFPMETTYLWADTETGGTRMWLRNSGEPTGFGGLAAPALSLAMRRANQNDLRRLKTVMERQ